MSHRAVPEVAYLDPDVPVPPVSMALLSGGQVETCGALVKVGWLVGVGLRGDADLLAVALDTGELTAAPAELTVAPAAGADELVQLPVGVGSDCCLVEGAWLRVWLGVGVLVTVTVGLPVAVASSPGPAVPVVLSLPDAVLWTAGGVELLD